MKNVYIIGVDSLKFGKYKEKDHRELVKETFESCLVDAGIAANDIQSVHFANSLWGYYNRQDGIRGHIAMRHCGLEKVPITNVEAACASGTLALHSAWKDILTGLFDCTLAVGVDKLYMDDKQKMFDAFYFAIDIANKEEVFQEWDEAVKNVNVPIPEYNQGARSPFMDIYANIALSHMDQYGTTQEQLAMVAAKNHRNGSLNPKAQFQFDMTTEQVLEDRIVSYPLTRSMCAPMGDGAASVILCSEEFLEKLPDNVKERAVKIASSVYMSGRERTLRERSTCAEAAELAYKMAGKTPEDIDVAEVHDASAIGEIIHYENLGFCPVGEGGKFIESGATQLDGKIPVNPSGGLISRGHPIAASGLGQIYELATQLRGEAGVRQVKGAKVALAENGGGNLGLEEAAFAVTILER